MSSALQIHFFLIWRNLNSGVTDDILLKVSNYKIPKTADIKNDLNKIHKL